MYQILINIAQPLVKAIGLFSPKIKKGVEGRNHTFDILKTANIKDQKNLWFHCASLGEYEQGLPVFTALKNKFPNHNLVLTFFSPSGYEIRKSNPITSIVCYLPLDTKSNAKAFIDIVKPELSVFVKYDIWPNYVNEIHKNNLKVILISALFRSNQIYFKSYGKIMTNTIKKFSHIFTQNQKSIDLLKKINCSSFSISGDTRFDRVSNQLLTNNTLDFIETFKDQKLCVVFGSSWKEDAELFIDFINKYPHYKYIIAPHNISKSECGFLSDHISCKTIFYSNYKESELKTANCFVVDTIGLLSKIYSYADISYVGGGMGNSGLHNILESAAFGSPIIIGKNYKNFPEAESLIKMKGVYAVENKSEFESIILKFTEDKRFRELTSDITKNYIMNNKGATQHIIDVVLKRKFIDY
jgi:3-deoxy-D-manno-octulosonic-acid transferase